MIWRLVARRASEEEHLDTHHAEGLRTPVDTEEQ